MTAQELKIPNQAMLASRPVARPQGDFAYRAAAIAAALMMLATVALR
jgi:hypothetical protein